MMTKLKKNNKLTSFLSNDEMKKKYKRSKKKNKKSKP